MLIINLFKVSKNLNKKTNYGIAAFSIVLILGGLIIELIVAGLFVGFYNSNTNQGDVFGTQALWYAQSGIDDAILRIVQNKDFTTAGCLNFVLDGRTIYIDVTNIGGTNKKQIRSKVTIGTYTRRVESIVSVNPISGKIDFLNNLETSASLSCG